MSILKRKSNEDFVPEWDKSLFSWSSRGNTKHLTTSPPQVVVKVVKVPCKSQTPAAHSPSRESTTPPAKRSAPISTGSSSSLSSLTTLSSDSAEDELDTRQTKKAKQSYASTPSESAESTKNASQSRKSAMDTYSYPRHGSSSHGASACATPEADAEESRNALPSKHRKTSTDALVRITESNSVSAETSRASSSEPHRVSSTKSKKKTSSQRTDETNGKIRRRRKRKALGDLTLPPKKGNYEGRAPVMLRSNSASRSTTACETDVYMPPMHKPPRTERVTWALEDGHVGEHLRHSREVVAGLTKIGRYITFFKNPNNADDKSYELSENPTVELEYPNTGAKETFLLARPKDVDHYDPTLDIENTLRTFARDIFPPDYRDLLGPFPEDALLTIIDSDESEPLMMPRDDSFCNSLASSSSPSRQSASSKLAASYAASVPSSPPPQSSSPRCSPPPRALMKTLIKARHREDGPTYRATLKEINNCILQLKEHESGENILRKGPHTWSLDGIPQSVILRIIEETYQRCVGPKISQLRKYEAFSSNVYGELTPAFVTDIIERTGLHSGSLFLDLGSGVGNVVLQTALQTGCTAFGIEEREDTALIANDQLEQMRLRCRMWGVSLGVVELAQGDMTTSSRVDELMSKADVVLVNNYVFTEELNAALRPKFLDLKEGACVVSLKPFASPEMQMLTERNFDDIAAIFDVEALPYHSGTVSWSSGSGMYYIHRVNREGYRANRETFEELHLRAARRRSARR